MRDVQAWPSRTMIATIELGIQQVYFLCFQ